MSGVVAHTPVIIGRATLYLGDCREILPTLGEPVSAVVTDPPYFEVKGDYWDNEWDNPDHFLGWLGEVVKLLEGQLYRAGSLYLFASPQMAARVECVVRQHMNVLANITWNKGARRKGAAGSGVDVTSLRTFWQAASERVIFAEPRGGDDWADEVAGYSEFREAKKRGVFGEYLLAEFERSGVSRKRVASLFPSASGGLTGCVSNWLLGYNCPTAAQYEAMRALLGAGFLEREHSDLLAAYEASADEIEEVKRGFEALRRPFNLNDKVQWGDVWDFDPPLPTSGKHPCEKPLPLMEHIINVSTKPGQIVLDAFTGSGATGVAAVKLGRQFIGIERDPHWFAVACKRIEDAQRQGDFFVEAAA